MGQARNRKAEIAALKDSNHIRFDLGQVSITAGASRLLNELGLNPGTFLQRHRLNDWGNMGRSDAAANNQSVRNGGDIIMSNYNIGPTETPALHRVWIITDASRTSTTILLPSEY